MISFTSYFYTSITNKNSSRYPRGWISAPPDRERLEDLAQKDTEGAPPGTLAAGLCRIGAADVGLRPAGSRPAGGGQTRAGRARAAGGSVGELEARAGLRCFHCRSSSLCLQPCLVPKKFCKNFEILRHIESLDACIEYQI